MSRAITPACDRRLDDWQALRGGSCRQTHPQERSAFFAAELQRVFAQPRGNECGMRSKSLCIQNRRYKRPSASSVLDFGLRLSRPEVSVGATPVRLTGVACAPCQSPATVLMRAIISSTARSVVHFSLSTRFIALAQTFSLLSCAKRKFLVISNGVVPAMNWL
jgi:hypothetical protein